MLTITTCIFKRVDVGSTWEKGVIINEDILIIDMEGVVVPSPVYTWRLRPDSGCMVVMKL